MGLCREIILFLRAEQYILSQVTDIVYTNKTLFFMWILILPFIFGGLDVASGDFSSLVWCLCRVTTCAYNPLRA